MIFDGITLHKNQSARFENGLFKTLANIDETTATDEVIDLAGDILCQGYVDLQVNGGDGVMFNDNPSVDTLTRIAKAHSKLGTVTLLPTLITDSIEKTTAAINATRTAIQQNEPGIAGLHLEGPHLSIARKGAHDVDYIRPMTERDLQELLAAKQHLPVLKVTIAPENVTTEQVSTLARAGILVALGHTDADYQTRMTYASAGARCATHLFNAMSQLGNREPGLVGAALDCGNLSAGLIADGIHVHPAAMRLACSAKAGPGNIYLVSDAMAVAGSDLGEFYLGGRRISRNNGRLTLDDGTLAGADLDLTTAIKVLTEQSGLSLDYALRAATDVPARLIGKSVKLQPDVTRLDSLIRIDSSLTGAQRLG
jgi:N-acetylglucosamine-6-phosphate deacetylase